MYEEAWVNDGNVGVPELPETELVGQKRKRMMEQIGYKKLYVRA